MPPSFHYRCASQAGIRNDNITFFCADCFGEHALRGMDHHGSRAATKGPARTARFAYRIHVTPLTGNRIRARLRHHFVKLAATTRALILGFVLCQARGQLEDFRQLVRLQI